MTQKDSKLALWLPVVFWAGFIFVLSSVPSLPGPTSNWLDFVFKKSSHMFVYGVLYFLVVRATKAKRPADYVAAFIMVFLYALSDELHQSLVPGRTPHIMDIGFDSVGASAIYVQKSFSRA